MSNQFLTIQEASEISNKSIQTIRRAIKAKKIKTKRRKTPQGFNYLIEKESFFSAYKISETKSHQQEKVKVSEPKDAPAQKADIPENKTVGNLNIRKDDFHSLVKALESMVAQHSEERQNFIRLMNTLQEKIFVLENQLNLLKEPRKHWYQLWK